MNQDKNIFGKRLYFPVAMWLSSRLIIAICMLLIAPLLPTPPQGVAATFSWDVFSAWDSTWYEKIATFGYEYINDGEEHSVAFFPLFSLICRAVMSIGLPFEAAGTLVNNFAFLGALIVSYAWINQHHGVSAARWATAVLAWFPLSIFGTVIYSEGLYLLFSAAALRAFDQKQNAWTVLWGAMATATRSTGIALIPALLLASWQEHRGIKAYFASLATSTGLLLYCLYCQLKFGDALAFFNAQKAWRPSLGFYWQGWLKILMQITLGPINLKYGYIKDFSHPLLFASIIAISYLLWRFRKQLGSVKVAYGFFALIIFSWLLVGDPLINAVTVFGGVYLLWQLRTQLTPVTVIYGFCSLGLILASGGTWSLSRIAYGIVSLSVALGVLLSRYPRWRYPVIGFFAILLASFSVRFSQHMWVG
jgi:Gpi18-like mannosyltransferase